MNPVHTNPPATRERARKQTPDWHETGEHYDGGPYFPDGGVAAPPWMIVNPLSKSPPQGQRNLLTGPATAEWHTPRSSHEQGRGVPAFKSWPRQFHTEAYDHSSLDVMPFPDQVGPIPGYLVNRPEYHGQAIPIFGEQYELSASDGGMGTGVANLQDPIDVAYAVGWGVLDTSPHP